MLELTGIHKSFGGIHALRGVDLRVAPGEIVGVIGGNGAGKSTLMKTAAGVHRPDAGKVAMNGTTPASPAHALSLGVSLVRQELIQANHLDVAANVLLGHEPHRFGVIDERALYREAARALERVGGGLDPRTLLYELSPGQKQLVEIARALSLNAKILLLDEPTATLTEGDADRLFVLLRALKAEGLGMVYISHRLREVMAVTDRIVCLRDGERVAELLTRETSRDELVGHLAGNTSFAAHEPEPPGAEVLLSVRGPLSFELRAGEILGLAGLVGAGRSSVLRRLFGAKRSDLTLSIAGAPVAIRSPRDAMAAGMAYVPEERASQGLILDMSVERNLALPSLKRFLLEDELGIAQPYMARFGIRGGGPARMLSGGNQQKIVLSKWMARAPIILLLDEPTRGLDIRAKRDVYDVVREISRRGSGVLLASSEAEELASLCHRALVLSQGQVRGELPRSELTDANILRLAT